MTPSENGKRWTGAGGRPSELPDALAPDEVRELMAVPNMDAPTGLRNRCMLELMLRNGLRVSETCGLHLRDVDWSTGELQLRGEITKGGVAAVTYLDERTVALLERWKAVRRGYTTRQQPHLFVTLHGAPVGRKYVWAMIRRYGRRAGLEHRELHPHMLRHTFATDLLRSGDFNLREVQSLMRHADVRTTQIYTHLSDAELARKMRERE